MTTIAWDGKTLAADKQTNIGDMGATTTKLHRLSDGSLVGGAGDSTLIRKRVKWIEDGGLDVDFPPSKDDNNSCSIMHITKDGKISYYIDDPQPIPIENSFLAVGSGRDFAMAAMHLGKSANEAVLVASLFDVYTGHGVDTLTLEGTCE